MGMEEGNIPGTFEGQFDWWDNMSDKEKEEYFKGESKDGN